MAIICPIPSCRAENDSLAEKCSSCGTPLRSYANLVTMPAQLYNQGLSEARAGRFSRARDLFAALVYWCPYDLEARGALAAACFSLGDREEARIHWEKVLTRSPLDHIAKRGLEELDSPASRAAPVITAKRRHKKK